MQGWTSTLCGVTVKITNTQNGKSVNAIVRDEWSVASLSFSFIDKGCKRTRQE